MARFQASAQYDVFNVVPLGDPLTKTPISGGYHVADPDGNYADVLGDLTLNGQGNMVGTATSISQYFSNDLAYASFVDLDADMLTGSFYYDNGYSIDGQTLYGETGETAYWLRGNDIVNGTIYNDVLAGFSGDDIVSGGGGADVLYGYNGADYLNGEGDNDILYGGIGGDTLLGGSGADVLYGGQGDDQLLGGRGWDDLQGGQGNDILRGALGMDTLTGGAGSDAFRFETPLDPQLNIDTITDFVSGVDRMELSASIFTAFADQVGQTVGLNQYLQYNQSTGYLSYDADGSGSGAAVPFAILGTSSHPSVGTDFLIV
jgi:Ca2+-binding RTX toxin-like protein